jgi:putative intracellular protease/amidase
MGERAAAKDVYLFVMDTMADWEAGFAVAGINQPTYQAEPGRFVVRTVGPSRNGVRTLGGITILPDLTLYELRPEGSAMLILPGAPAWDVGEHDAAAQKAAEFLDAGVPVAAICGATAGLARAGLLDGRPHTSNGADYLAAVPGYAGGAFYIDEPAVGAGDLITASGTAPVAFAYRIFQRLELFAPPVLAAWYALFARGDASVFHALAADAAPGEAV